MSSATAFEFRICVCWSDERRLSSHRHRRTIPRGKVQGSKSRIYIAVVSIKILVEILLGVVTHGDAMSVDSWP